MAAKPIPPADLLRQVLRYDPETGKLFWRQNSIMPETPMRRPGREALTCSTEKGYKRGGVLGRNVMAHRVAWKIVHDEEPDEIDHINGIKDDNRLSNLRAVSRTENVRNQGMNRNNKSGVKGVHFTKGKWTAQIRDGGVQITLGYFNNFEDAVTSRKEAEIAFGYHLNHGGR